MKKTFDNFLPIKDSLPFNEYHKFNKWVEDNGWYEASNEEYDNLNDPNSCIRLNIKELYFEYIRRNNLK